MANRLKMVVSGGQTGVDQAALRVAEMLNIRTGGWIPKGFRTDDGPAPWLGEKYGLMETKSSGYPQRTLRNIRMAHGTLIMGHLNSPGCQLTAKNSDPGRLLKINHKEKLPDAVRKIRMFIEERKIEILNVAGNRESSYPGIGKWAEMFLYEALKRDDTIIQ